MLELGLEFVLELEEINITDQKSWRGAREKQLGLYTLLKPSKLV